MKCRFINSLVFILLLATCAAALPKSARGIKEADLRAHVEFLASPELAGRDAPGEGAAIAERYIATRFKEYGLQEFPDAPGYYQEVPLIVSKTDYENSRLIVSKGGVESEFIPDRDVFFFPRGGEDADIIAPVLLAGYGIRAPEFKWDDFAGAEPGGKFLLIFNREPQENDSTSPFNGAKATKYSQPAVKVRIARELGARGLLIIQPPNNGLPPIEEMLERYRRTMHDAIVQLADERASFPIFYLKAEVAKAILGDDFDLAAYQEGLDERYQGKPIPIENAKVTLSMRFKEVQETVSANVVGYYCGKSDEAVLIMAHHDHLGSAGDGIYYGADDNASGVAGLLALAQAYSAWGGQTRRSVIFLSTTAEEDGTLGALYFSKHLPIPVEKIVAAINLDEIGRDASSQFRAMQDSSIPAEENMLMIFYSGQTPELADIAQKENKSTKLKLILEPVLHFSGSSDHIHFHDLGIPSLFVFSGFHSDYHTPRDTPDKIDYEKMTRICRLMFGLSRELAQASPRPIFDRTITRVDGTGRKYGN